jgi:hypothetical protein
MSFAPWQTVRDPTDRRADQKAEAVFDHPDLCGQHAASPDAPVVARLLRLNFPMKRARPTNEHRPGALPDIRTSACGVTFIMAPCGSHTSERLIIRCDDSGEILVSIGPDLTRQR